MGARGPQPSKPVSEVAGGDPISEEPPEWMNASESALDMYRILAVALNEIGLVRAIHQNALVTYCESWEREREMQKTIEDDGAVAENPEKGTLYIHPATNVQKMAQNEMARQAKILGMEVSQLDALRVAKPDNSAEKDDPKDANSYLP